MTMQILCGIPGSGKSTYARSVEGAFVVSADDFFVNNGVYEFNRSSLGEAHGRCFRRACAWASNPLSLYPTLVVDNTNLSAIEVAPYMALAQAFGARCELHIFRASADVALCHSRQIHGVSEEQLSRMSSRWEEFIAWHSEACHFKHKAIWHD